MVNLHRRTGIDDPDAPGLVSTVEATTLQLEFRYLSFLTDNDRYWKAVERVFRSCIYLNWVNLVLGYESHQSCEATVICSSSKLP
jgi:Glycosyl hydrolase family 47